MVQLTLIQRDGTKHILLAAEGVSLMEVARDNGVDDLLALCGGSCACATCHVYVDTGFFDRLPVMSEDENDLLDTADHREANSRLACQIEITSELDGMRVRVATE